MTVTQEGGSLVGVFTFGLYLGAHTFELKHTRGAKHTSAFVLDSKTMKFGWVQYRLLMRAR